MATTRTTSTTTTTTMDQNMVMVQSLQHFSVITGLRLGARRTRSQRQASSQNIPQSDRLQQQSFQIYNYLRLQRHRSSVEARI
eukprot:7775758-Pyramimonas_sp.AAC.1